MKIKKEVLACDFCGKSQEDVEQLIAGPEPRVPCICDKCVALCVTNMEEMKKEKEANHG